MWLAQSQAILYGAQQHSYTAIKQYGKCSLVCLMYLPERPISGGRNGQGVLHWRHAQEEKQWQEAHISEDSTCQEATLQHFIIPPAQRAAAASHLNTLPLFFVDSIPASPQNTKRAQQQLGLLRFRSELREHFLSTFEFSVRKEHSDYFQQLWKSHSGNPRDACETAMPVHLRQNESKRVHSLLLETTGQFTIYYRLRKLQKFTPNQQGCGFVKAWFSSWPLS